MALPIILILTSFFVIENLKDLKIGDTNAVNANGFNSELPGETPTLDSGTAGRQWKVKDSLKRKKEDNSEARVDMKDLGNSENDSLQRILKQLEGLSMKPEAKETNFTEIPEIKGSVDSRKRPEMSEDQKKQQFVENRLAYREKLLEGKEKMIGDSQNSRGHPSLEPIVDTKKPISIRATVYGDQFILPNENVRLLLMEDMVHNSKRFARNTFIYAMATIKENRVYLDIDNIEHHPVNLLVKDFNDGREGIYSTRAGELWREYEANASNNLLTGATEELTNGSPDLVADIARGLGSFFRKKKLREKEKILLIDDYELLLVTQ
ncbi:conjugative transposon protein TraM [Costertonia aggregata]|uniref:Conjugative transposon protein TraM n=1 Tax=Costertonia aggregata TaxID=343403 RepID=A0A7H9AT11_9FLAO|nr:conjugative transposon protein TraM [Costertonia aggregata]QLG46580.1 conjugative transposon protein TraM [Costertonia aggregata]